MLYATIALFIEVSRGSASSEGVINATEGHYPDTGLTILGFTYGSVTVKASVLTYSEYAARGYNLENDFNPNVIPTTAADSRFSTLYKCIIPQIRKFSLLKYFRSHSRL
jgi:hypothetical protein